MNFGETRRYATMQQQGNERGRQFEYPSNWTAFGNSGSNFQQIQRNRNERRRMAGMFGQRATQRNHRFGQRAIPRNNVQRQREVLSMFKRKANANANANAYNERSASLNARRVQSNANRTVRNSQFSNFREQQKKHENSIEKKINEVSIVRSKKEQANKNLALAEQSLQIARKTYKDFKQGSGYQTLKNKEKSHQLKLQGEQKKNGYLTRMYKSVRGKKSV
tara:strand:+ start:7164 stop:7826 length:663 start_codon:yes stop_codon:yes gene_type:complete